MNEKLASKLLGFGCCFDQAKMIWDRRHGLSIAKLDDYRLLASRPLDAMVFFTICAHERPVASPRYPISHRMALLTVIDASNVSEHGANEKFEDRLLKDENFPEHVWTEFKRLEGIESRKDEQRRKIERYTKGPVHDILKELQKVGEPNIVVFLRSQELRKAYNSLKELDGIDHKIAALFLRDTWDYIGHDGRWQYTPLEDRYCTQPVDRWVKFWVEKCWHEIVWPQSAEECAKLLTSQCIEKGIDPVNFNKGAWFVGAHFQRLCAFFNIPIKMRLHNYPEVMEGFDADIAKQAIANLADLESSHQAFSV